MLKTLLSFLLGLFVSQAVATETVIYYHNDALGSPIAATDAQGRVIWREQYLPYGERLIKEPGSRNQLWYTGKPEEEALGLSYFGARWYDPSLGRFISMDPAEMQEGNPHSFNRYAYANNNPYKFVDPDGRAVETVTDLVSLGISVGTFIQDPSLGNGLGVLVDAVGTAVPFLPAGVGIIRSSLKAAGEVGDVARVTKHSPINPGPLADDIANTFRNATYTEKALSKDTILYRVISDNGNPTGSYWTRVKPQGPLQSVIDSGLDQNWGNTAARVVTARVPAGTKIYEGIAAPQRGLVGGGNQVYIPKVDPKWIQ